jgi:hypothetical protein
VDVRWINTHFYQFGRVNMLNICVNGDAHANAILELKQLHTSEIQKLTAELTSMSNKISDVSGKLEEGIRGVEELRGVVVGHRHTRN